MHVFTPFTADEAGDETASAPFTREPGGMVLRVSFQTGTPADWLIWQLADSAFPTGGFAHSNGVEAAWQSGEIRDSAELAAFLEGSIVQFCHGSLPLMHGSYADPCRLGELDLVCDSFTLNPVANRASRLQGKSLLSSAKRIFGGSAASLPEKESLPCCHLAPVFGVVMRGLGMEQGTASRLFVFQHLRSLVAGAVRLGIVGPMEGQALQQAFAPVAESAMGRCLDLPPEAIAQTSPLQEIWQGSQDRLYSRLFQS